MERVCLNCIDDLISPICMSVWIHPSERPVLIQSVLSIYKNEIHRIVVYTESTRSMHVPLSLLRNLCIRQVVTSHYIVLDAETMPSDNLYSTLRSIPSELLNQDKFAFIISPVYLTLSNDCTHQRCFDKYEFYQRVIHRVPKNEKEMIECMDKKQCRNVQDNFHTPVRI